MDIKFCNIKEFNHNNAGHLIEEHWYKIPSINTRDISQLKNGCLVRFNGMIQDMHSPEYYLDQFEVENNLTKEKLLRNGKYRDSIEVGENETFSFESPQNVNRERQTFVLVSTPGLNQWVYEVEKQNDSLNRETNVLTTPINKRKNDDMDVDNNDLLDTNVNVSSNKKTCNNQKHNPIANECTLSPEFLLNSPLMDRSSKTCLIKMYENYDSMKINDLIEIVGFLSVDPIVNSNLSSSVETDDSTDMELQVMHPPPSLIPRVHCLQHRIIQHDNPLIPVTYESSAENEYSDVYNDLHRVLTQLLLGDKLAAEYLICHLISKV